MKRKKILFVAQLILTIQISGYSQERNSIIWRGGFETGDFMQWHNREGTAPEFSAIPSYGAPVEYGGDGSCLSLETEIVRDGNYAAKFTTKNSINGSEPEDCQGLPDCGRRKVELKGWYALTSEDSAIMPYLSERWMSVSHYIPEDWDDGGDGWGPTLFQNKPYINNSKVSPTFAIALDTLGWKIHHRWSDYKWVSWQLPWEQQMFYTGDYPKIGVYPEWDDGVADFPDPEASRAALTSVNKGGWTDWVIHVKWDARGKDDGGTGFLIVYKREDDGPWVQILDIRPRFIRRGSIGFDRGIGYNEPKRDGDYEHWTHWGGFSINVGQYQDKDRTWHQPDNRTVITDNVKIGNKHATLEEMAPNIKTTGLSRKEPDQGDFKLFPNPLINNTFKIRGKGFDDNTKVRIYDALGVEIANETKLSRDILNVSLQQKVSPGFLFCKVFTENYSRVFIVNVL